MIEQEIVTKWQSNRSPGVMLVDFWSIFQAGAVGHAPGPNFGRTSAENLEKLVYIYIYIYISQCGPGGPKWADVPEPGSTIA